MIIAIIVSIYFSTCLVYAHGERTDASGLGSYHYYCGGYQTHLHNGGICQYSSPAVTSTSCGSETSTTNSKTTSTSNKISTIRKNIRNL